MDETYLWSHEPELSAEPVERIKHNIDIRENEVDEIAIFKLQNDKYLYIKFVGVIDNIQLGITDIEEFDTLSEAEEVYKTYLVEFS